jgi:hypothetical protein
MSLLEIITLVEDVIDMREQIDIIKSPFLLSGMSYAGAYGKR